MDADLQDPPEVIPQLISQWRTGGADVAYAVRTKRRESWRKRSAYWLFYRSLRRLAAIEIPVDSGDFSLLDRKVVDALLKLPEHHRFLRGLRSWVGFRQEPVNYDRDNRHSGIPKYGFRSLLRLTFSGYFGFSTVPLRLAAWIGVLVAFAGFGVALWGIAAHVRGVPTPAGWASILSSMLFAAGVQLLFLGVIGEYLARVYDEVRQRPHFITREAVGFDDGRVPPSVNRSELRTP